MDNYKIILAGQLWYDGCLRLSDRETLLEMIMNYLPCTPLEVEKHNFGEVKVTIEFVNYSLCPTCGSIQRRWIGEG